MSRIGKVPVNIPSGVDIKIEGREIFVKGPKGSMSAPLVEGVNVDHSDSKISFSPIKAVKNSNALWGLQRTLVSNLVVGVTEGFFKELEIIGVGYRGQLKGKELVLNLGFSHDVNYKIPDGITITMEGQNQIKISGCCLEKLYGRTEVYNGRLYCNDERDS